jgi:hypothetical protein
MELFIIAFLKMQVTVTLWFENPLKIWDGYVILCVVSIIRLIGNPNVSVYSGPNLE